MTPTSTLSPNTTMAPGPSTRLQLTHTDLSYSHFVGVHLRGAVFEDVSLNGAVLRNVCLSGVSIQSPNLEGLTINGILVTDLLWAYHLAQQQGL